MTVEIITSKDLDQIRAELERLRQEVQALQFQRAAAPEKSPWMTKRQVADYLSVSVSTVGNYVRAGRLAKHYINSQPRYLRVEVEKL